jgi:hypothetical protein
MGLPRHRTSYSSTYIQTTMNGNQPEASTSTSIPPSKHYVSLVIDSELPREQYSRLIETEGVVHSLVQRLLEKHGGDKHVSHFFQGPNLKVQADR